MIDAVAVLYRRIAGELRDQIARGELRPGDRLATEPQLMERYQVSRNTVRLAVAQLVNEGLVVHVPGRSGGMIVRERVTLTYHASRAEQPDGLRGETDAYISEVRDQGYTPSQTFESKLISLTPEIAERLEVDEGSTAVLRRCLRSVNNIPHSIQDSFYPMDLAEEVRELLSPTDIPQGTTRLLAERGHQQVAFREEISTRMPNVEEARLLDLGAGTPVLEYVRTAYTAQRPVRVTVTIFAGDRNRIVYILGDASVMDRED
jgi:GntR family transcriptional regulator